MTFEEEALLTALILTGRQDIGVLSLLKQVVIVLVVVNVRNMHDGGHQRSETL